MLKIENFRKQNVLERIAITRHAKERLKERNIISKQRSMGSRFYNKKGEIVMLCMECGAKAEKGYTTDVTDLGNCLVIVRNVPCYKCVECNEIIYTGDVLKRLEEIVDNAKKVMQEISIVDYSKVA